MPNRTRIPAGPDWMKRAQARYYEASETRHYPVHAGLANHLIASLIDRDFDVASANALPEGQGEGHAFGFVHRRLMNGAAIPVVPVVLNTYYPPNQPSPRRCYRLGQAIRAAVEGYPESLRVGVVASGGLSHFTVDEALDGEVSGRCAKGRRGAANLAAPAAQFRQLGDPQLDLRRRRARASRPRLGRTIAPATARLQEPARACASPAGRDGRTSEDRTRSGDPRRLALDVGVLQIG